jgi:hypothetical protein
MREKQPITSRQKQSASLKAAYISMLIEFFSDILQSERPFGHRLCHKWYCCSDEKTFGRVLKKIPAKSKKSIKCGSDHS